MKTQITANTFALTIDVTVAQIHTLEKNNPDALKVFDEKKENVKFAVSYVEGKPSVADFCVTFNTKDRTSGKAILTGNIPASCDTDEKAKAYVAEKIGAAYAYLKELEKSIPEAAEKILSAKKEIVDSITVQ